MGIRIIIATLASALFIIVYDIAVLRPKIEKQKQMKQTKEEKVKEVESEIREIPLIQSHQSDQKEFVVIDDDFLKVFATENGIKRIEMKEHALEAKSKERYFFENPFELNFISEKKLLKPSTENGVLLSFENGITGEIKVEKISKYIFELNYILYGEKIDITPVVILKKSAPEQSDFIVGKNRIIDARKIKEPENVDFVGERTRYFAFLVLPPGNSYINSPAHSQIIFYPPKIFASKVAEVKFRFFAGPKDEEELKLFSPFSVELASFGFFGGIAKLLIFVLEKINALVKNWGFSIIILSIIIRILFFPLSLISIKSMKKIKDLQPQIEKLKEKYKDNKEALSRELFELYRREKINPFSGCLPLLIQIPIFIALYQGLMNSIDLRHAPFILWINDLSSPDTLAIIKLFGTQFELRLLPIIMGLTFLAQQALTPQTTQDISLKILNYIMPVMFIFILWSVPSGLQVYWITINIIGIIQQFIAIR